ncbi:DUF3116 family protein [Listeria grandensis]|uniref:DUF3116 family protein n=1 Tax=Listeria grandensis TaxID=1494963 RepID=A0A7X1CQ97_9LIST|nr:DUF3116 family protein [Listeria grandensis]MBC1475744.1 DUF3116 family protein [Listeria grandensis]MBC1936803.1 DUF3116 family protein [Listeria grandensis]
MDEVQLTALEIEIIKRVLDKDFYIKILKEDIAESKYTLNNLLYTLYSLEEKGLIERNVDTLSHKRYTLVQSPDVVSLINESLKEVIVL